MKIELRGTIRAVLGTSTIQIEVPADGVPLSDLLHSAAVRYPRARPYLSGDGGTAVLRVIVNGAVVPADGDPWVRPEDDVLLMHAVAGGG